VRHTLEQCVFLYDTYVKYGSTRTCRWKFWRKFCDGRFPRRHIIHNLVNKLRTIWLLIDNKQKHKCWVLTEEKLDEIGATLEPTPRKSLKCLSEETGVSKSNARTATRLLKLRPCKTTVIYTCLASVWSSKRVHFCSWFLQTLVEDEVDLQLTFFSDEAWFHLQGYMDTQSNIDIIKKNNDTKNWH
jgi:hypothetical protein